LRVALTESFRRSYKKLPGEIQEKADRQIETLAENLRHPSLRVKKIKGTQEIWEARVDRGYRMTFAVNDGVIILRQVGPHDPTLKRP